MSAPRRRRKARPSTGPVTVRSAPRADSPPARPPVARFAPPHPVDLAPPPAEHPGGLLRPLTGRPADLARPPVQHLDVLARPPAEHAGMGSAADGDGTSLAELDDLVLGTAPATPRPVAEAAPSRGGARNDELRVPRGRRRAGRRGAPRASRAAGASWEAAHEAGVVVGVVAPATGLPAAVGGVAAGLRASSAARVVVVATTEAAAAGAPALPRAARLARDLRERGLLATGTGAVCHVRLPDGSGAPEDELRRLEALAAPAPVVVGVAGRTAAGDDLLAGADRLVLVLPPSAPAALALLTRESLQQLGPPVACRRFPADPLGRRLAAAGLRGLGPAAANAADEHEDSVSADAGADPPPWAAVDGSRG